MADLRTSEPGTGGESPANKAALADHLRTIGEIIRRMGHRIHKGYFPPSVAEDIGMLCDAANAEYERGLLARWLETAYSGHWRDRAELSLAAHPLADETREHLVHFREAAPK